MILSKKHFFKLKLRNIIKNPKFKNNQNTIIMIVRKIIIQYVGIFAGKFTLTSFCSLSLRPNLNRSKTL